MSSRRSQDMSSRRLQRDNFSSSKTSWRRLEDVFKIFCEMSSRRICKTSSRCLGRRKIVTLKTSWRRLEDMSWRRLEDMSWRRLQHVFSVTILRLPRHLQDVFKTSWKTKNCYAEDMLKTSSTCLEDVLKTNKYLLGMFFLLAL